MKQRQYILFFLIFLPYSLMAGYSISFKNIKVGNIKSLATLKHNYIEIDITNPIARFMAGKDTMIYYNDQYSQDKNKNAKYKKDRYQVIELLKITTQGKISQKDITIKKDKIISLNKTSQDHFNYIYNSKNRIKAKGSIKIKEQKLVALIDSQNGVEIIRQN